MPISKSDIKATYECAVRLTIADGHSNLPQGVCVHWETDACLYSTVRSALT